MVSLKKLKINFNEEESKVISRESKKICFFVEYEHICKVIFQCLD